MCERASVPSADACNCTDGYSGRFCHKPANCPTAVTDNSGACCTSGVVNATGSCCNSTTAALDRSGGCCESGTVDACGVCGGGAKVVDIMGTCCTGTLDAASVCCPAGSTIDGCGVCDGTGACPLDVSTSIAYDPNTVAATSQSFASAAGVPGSWVTAASSGSSGRRLSLSQRRQASGATTVFTISGGNAQPVDEGSITLSLADSTAFSTSVQSLRRDGVCGNGICEAGERCDESVSSACCVSDCPMVLSSCPAPAGSSVPCGGNGLCLLASGSCECFTEVRYPPVHYRWVNSLHYACRGPRLPGAAVCHAAPPHLPTTRLICIAPGLITGSMSRVYFV